MTQIVLHCVKDPPAPGGSQQVRGGKGELGGRQRGEGHVQVPPSMARNLVQRVRKAPHSSDLGILCSCTYKEQ